MRRIVRVSRYGLAALALALLPIGCAKISTPVGGEVDREPPQVISTDPEPYSVVPDRDRPVVIRFDERISEKRVQEAVMVSPETGAVRVKKGRSELRISLDGGWRPGQVYRVVLLPVLQDLFNNSVKEEVELIFSTGPEIPATAFAGQITDRITGKPVGGARVEALGQPDSVRYVALSDTAGFFALRHIPAGDYTVQAYQDRNRNGRLDFGEPEERELLPLGPADTTIVSYSLLPADTTPARLVRAEEVDSLQLRLTLDDYLDPLESLDGVQVEIRELPDSIPVEAGVKIVHLHEFERRRAEQKAAADSVRAAEEAARAARDSAEVGLDSTGAAPVVAAVAADSAALTGLSGTVATRRGLVEAELERAPANAESETGEPLPVRELVVVPERPLARKTRYWIRVMGVRNINGLEGGGGEVIFETAADVPVDSVGTEPTDSSGVVRPDSVGGAGPDSSRVAEPDSSGVARPDSTGGRGPDPAKISVAPAGAGAGSSSSRAFHLLRARRR
jgi:hypothetical protein